MGAAHVTLGLTTFETFDGFYREVYGNDVADALTERRGEVDVHPDVLGYELLVATCGLTREEVMSLAPFLEMTCHIAPVRGWLCDPEPLVAIRAAVAAGIDSDYLRQCALAGIGDLATVTEGFQRGIPANYLAAAA